MTKMKRLSKKVLELVMVICILATMVAIPVSAEMTDGAADLIYFNDFSDINTISFDDRGTEKTTYGKIDTDTEGGHSSVYKHYMQTGTSRQTFMTSTLPVKSTISGKRLAISFQLKYDISETDEAKLAPMFFVDVNSGRVSGDASVRDNTLFHIIPGEGYYVGGAARQRTLFAKEDLKFREWNRFDIVIDQASSPATGKVYANGRLCAEVTYPAVADFNAIDKFIISSFTYDTSLENATRDTVNNLPMIDNFKVYEADENDTFGFVASEVNNDTIYAELGGTVSEIPTGITAKKVGTNNSIAVNAELVKGHMIKIDLGGAKLDAGAEYMIEVPDGMTDMYGRKFDDILLFNAPAGEVDIINNGFDTIGSAFMSAGAGVEVKVVEEDIAGYGNVLETVSTRAAGINSSWIGWAQTTIPLGKTIDSGKINFSFDFRFHLPKDENNTETGQGFNLYVYPANIAADGKTVTVGSKDLFRLIPGGDTWILRTFSAEGNVQWRPSVTDYAITEKYHTLKFEIDKSGDTPVASVYSDDMVVGKNFVLHNDLRGAFNAILIQTQADNNASKNDLVTHTTRIDNFRAWEEAYAMDLRIVNMDGTELLPEAEIPNAFKGFKAYFDGETSPAVTLTNNTDNTTETVNVKPNADGTEHTITLTEFLDAGDSYTLSVANHKYNFTTTDSGMIISGFGLYKANGDKVEKFSDVTIGETLTAKANIYNGGGKNICISYGIFGDKFMKAFDFNQYNDFVAGIDGTPVEVDVVVTADMLADSIEIYLWNDFNGLVPYEKCIEIK